MSSCLCAWLRRLRHPAIYILSWSTSREAFCIGKVLGHSVTLAQRTPGRSVLRTPWQCGQVLDGHRCRLVEQAQPSSARNGLPVRRPSY